MKKVIASKPIGSVKSCPQRQLEGPKPLICNNWLLRNDSTNVQAILHPDLPPKKYRKQITHDGPHTQKKVYKKLLLSSNTCYCKEKATRPTLFKRPNKCLSLEEIEQRLKENDLLKGLLKSRKSLHCFCKGIQASVKQIDLSDIETLRKIQDEIDELNDQLPVTDQRKDYEMYREEEYANYLREISEYEDENENENYCLDESDQEYDVGNNVETIMGTTKSNSRHHSSKFGKDGLLTSDLEQFEDTESSDDENSDPDSRHLIYSKVPSKKALNTDTKITKDSMQGTMTNVYRSTTNGSMDVQKIRQFRDYNYFETHDVDDHLGRDIPEHTCVHQFRLDERLLPQAVSIDRYGKSRCTICSKPMENKTHTQKSIFSDKISPEKMKTFTKCIELGLAPHDISIGASNRIELKVKMEDFTRFGKFIGSYRRPCNINTFALRQQKMATYWKYK